MQSGQPNDDGLEDQRRRRFRRTVVLLLLAILLLLFAVLLYGWATPDWLPNGARPAHSAWVRGLIAAAFIGGTVLAPLGVRELILALVPSKSLGLVLALAIGIAGLIAIPVEIWLTMLVTEGLEPGAQQRYEHDANWDWDD